MQLNGQLDFSRLCSGRPLSFRLSASLVAAGSWVNLVSCAVLLDANSRLLKRGNQGGPRGRGRGKGMGDVRLPSTVKLAPPQLRSYLVPISYTFTTAVRGEFLSLWYLDEELLSFASS
jgi:hypothetical protein